MTFGVLRTREQAAKPGPTPRVAETAIWLAGRNSITVEFDGMGLVLGAEFEGPQPSPPDPGRLLPR